VENAVALYERIEAWAATFETAEALVERLERAGVTAARIRTVSENLEDPHLIARGTLSPVTFPGHGDVLMQTAPYRFTGCAVRPGAPAPHVGQHTEEVLRDVLGVPDAELDDLYRTGAVHGGRNSDREHDG
jgi:CoA:oxalate CoA-transferase